MKSFAVALTLSAMLAAGPVYAQAPPAPRPAAPAAPAAPRPAAPAPAAQQPAAPPAPQRVPFQAGLKYAYINIQDVAANSNEGKALSAKVKALQDQKAKEVQDKNKALQAAQEKLEKSGGVMNEAARAQLQLDIERQQRDLQRLTEDAQQDLQTLAQQLQDEFGRKLNPIIDQVAREAKVDFVFNAAESGLVWAQPGMDLTADVIKAFDAAGKTPAPAPAR